MLDIFVYKLLFKILAGRLFSLSWLHQNLNCAMCNVSYELWWVSNVVSCAEDDASQLLLKAEARRVFVSHYSQP